MAERRRKILWQIFPSFLIITIISLGLITGYSTRFFRELFLNNTENDLTVRAKLIRRELTCNPIETVDTLVKTIGRQIQTRITVVLPSGRVIGDSFSDISGMDNHANRPEIVAALQGSKGVSIRHSDTLGTTMMYVAVPWTISEASEGIVRTSLSIADLEDRIAHVRRNMLVAWLITACLAAGVSLLVSRRITRPIEEMKSGAQRFLGGDLKHRLSAPESEELSQLAMVMNQMAATLDEKLANLENRGRELEAVHASMLEGLIAVDQEEKIITINAAAAEMFDYPAPDLIGRNLIEAVRDYDLQKLISRALDGPDPVEGDIHITGKEERILNVHSTSLQNETGQRMGTLIIFHDITRIRKLETMHKDFAANVSHELKTPLTSIKGFIETLQDHMVDGSWEQGKGFLAIIEKNVNRMIALVDDLLALSRLERDQGKKIVFEHHEVSQIIEGAVKACQPSLDGKKIQLTVTCPEGLTVMVDPLLMEQGVVNLLDNAAKYSHESGRVTLEALKSGNKVLIRVSDEGIGINRDHAARIFQRFYRVDKARSRDQGGTGLGLAIVKHIVQYHRGEIRVESVPHKGSTFEITLPEA